MLQTPESFLIRFNVDVRINSEVIFINRHDKTVSVRNLKDGTEYVESYDQLLLSPGAAPVVPPIPGIDNPLTFFLRNIPDMDKIMMSIEHNKPAHATVVGGGFIGLEMMEALHHHGIAVTLIEFSDQVMAPVDIEMASFLHQEIISKGVELELGVELNSVQFHPAQSESKTGHLSLVLGDNRSLKTDLLIMAVGVRPETSLARKAGLRTGNLGGVVTNDHMQTSDPDIYAVADAVEVSDFLTGYPTLIPLASPANRQGRIAADNMLGRSERYHGTQGTAICRIFDLIVAATGKNEKALKTGNYSAPSEKN